MIFSSPIFNRFDFLIRFLYVRIPIISKLINRLFFWKLYSSDYTGLDRAFEKIEEKLLNEDFDIKNKIVLEVGPGNSYINAYNFLVNGAKKVYLVDKYPRFIKGKKQKKYIDSEIEYIIKKYNLTRLEFDSVIDGNIITITKDLDDISENEVENVDLIVSLSVFEHIKKVKENIKRMNELLSDRGLMYHSIDLRDHYNFNEPFLFYKYSNKVWDKYLTKEGFSYTNRWRFDDYVNEFELNNLDLITIEKNEYSIGKFNIDKIFKNRNDISIGKASFLLKKR